MSKRKRLLFNVAEIGFCLAWDYPPLLRADNPYYQGFLFKSGIDKLKKDLRKFVEINLYWAKGEKPALKGSQKILSFPKFWNLYRNSTSYLMEMFHPLKKRPLSFAEIDFDFKNVEYYLLGPENGLQRVNGSVFKEYWFLSQPVDPLIKSLLVNILAREGGSLLHSAGVIVNNCGLVFCGESGSGKSTLAEFFRLDKESIVLTDENLVINKKEGKFYIHATPWPGGARISYASRALLKNVFFIRHAKNNLLLPLKPDEAFKKILSQTVLCVWEQPLLDSLLDFLRELSEKIEFFVLEFVNERSVVDFLKKKISL